MFFLNPQSTKELSNQNGLGIWNKSDLVVTSGWTMHRCRPAIHFGLLPFLICGLNDKLAVYFILDCLVKFAALAAV